MRQGRIFALAAASVGLGAAGCATDHSYYGDYAYVGSEHVERRPYPGDLDGPGVGLLDPWLAQTVEGRAIVTLGFRDAARGFVSEEVAHRANIWFRRYADHDRDMTITDPEIRTALVAAAGRYLD